MVIIGHNLYTNFCLLLISSYFLSYLKEYDPTFVLVVHASYSVVIPLSNIKKWHHALLLRNQHSVNIV